MVSSSGMVPRVSEASSHPLHRADPLWWRRSPLRECRRSDEEGDENERVGDVEGEEKGEELLVVADMFPGRIWSRWLQSSSRITCRSIYSCMLSA